jgi:hypothetical protein
MHGIAGTSAGDDWGHAGTAGLGLPRLERSARPEDRDQDDAAARVAWTEARRDLEARGTPRNLGGYAGSLLPRPLAAHADPVGLDGA